MFSLLKFGRVSNICVKKFVVSRTFTTSADIGFADKDLQQEKVIAEKKIRVQKLLSKFV